MQAPSYPEEMLGWLGPAGQKQVVTMPLVLNQVTEQRSCLLGPTFFQMQIVNRRGKTVWLRRSKVILTLPVRHKGFLYRQLYTLSLSFMIPSFVAKSLPKHTPGLPRWVAGGPWDSSSQCLQAVCLGRMALPQADPWALVTVRVWSVGSHQNLSLCL